ncbi:hypothetical protein ACOMHN_025397 [Nucella lapillus]
MDWWSDQQKAADDKDNWKVFNTDKKALKQRWWEEDWQEDQWWAPKDSNNSTTIPATTTTTTTTTTIPSTITTTATTTTTTTTTKSSRSRTKYTNKKKKGEDKADFSHGGQKRQLTKKQQKGKAGVERVAQLKAPPQINRDKTLRPKKVKSKVKEGVSPKRESMPAAESPWEKMGPVWDGEALISPFEDPKPAPLPGSRDEGPPLHPWEHHHLTGLGRYIDHNHSKQPAKHHDKENQNDEHSLKKSTKERSKMAEKRKNPKVNIARKTREQFYGFGLESKLSAPANELKNVNKPHTAETKQPQKLAQYKTIKKASDTDSYKHEAPTKEPAEKFSEDNYNKGVIYDVIPSPAEQNHPVEKNLIASVKKEPSSVEYDQDFVSTKASLQTSPNPPPPDLAHEGVVDSETTPVVPNKKSGKKGQTKLYVKSRPLTFCKLNSDCRKGRKCRRGLCVCLVEGECKGKKAVCGSDGVQYSSHCELHRTACITRRHIKVDHITSCQPKEEKHTTVSLPEASTVSDTTTTPTTPTTTTPTTTTPTTTTHTTTTTPKSSQTAVFFESDEYDDDDDPEVQDNEDDDDRGKRDDEEYYDDEYYDEDYEGEKEVEEEEEGDEVEEEEEEEEDEEEKNENHSGIDEIDSRADNDQDRNTATTPLPEIAQEKTTQHINKGDNSKAKGDNRARKLSKTDDDQDSNNVQDEKQEDKRDYDYQSDGSFLECSKKELKRFKKQLLAFYCQRFQEPDCKLEVKEERDYLSNLLFSYLDMNTDYQVSFRELRTRQASPHLPQLSPACDLTDLIWNDDVQDIDGQLSLQEFAEAFAHLYEAEKDNDEDEGKGYGEEEGGQSSSSSSSSPSSPVVNIIPTLATVGNGLELKCGLDASGARVVWKRHGVNIRDLDLAELLVLEDGSLFFSKMGVHHMGNYSCQDIDDPSVLQVHSLKVQMPPIVKVSPQSQIQPSKATVRLRCHAEGVPRPSITWQMNHLALHTQPHRYNLAGNKEQLTIFEADYQKDTGAYKCVARNQAGTAQDLASLFIIGDKDRSVGSANRMKIPTTRFLGIPLKNGLFSDTPSITKGQLSDLPPMHIYVIYLFLQDWLQQRGVSMGFTNTNAGKFAVFHSQGYTTYDPNDCLKHRTVHGDFGYFKFIPDSLDRPLRLCEPGRECEWGDVVNVRNSLLYVTQPAMNRVVVIETAKNWIPVQVIATDRRPMQVRYVPQLDQVWVVCWNGGQEEEEGSNKTMVVVRDASKYIQHRVVHTQPVGNRFDQIQALFIAPANDLQHTYDYGYVTHSGQQTLTKIDLDNMRYVNTIHLSPYDCVPRSLAFVPIGGHVVVECVSSANHQTLQLVLDYLTDAVVSTGLVSGRPHVSPNSRHVVTVDDLTGKVSVAGVSNEGSLEAAYEVTVSASISDVAFFPALGHGYLLVLTSADDDDIITINLSTGKVDKIKGTNRRATSSDWYPSPVKRAIISGDVFSDFLLAPSKSSISIMAMNRQRVQCEYTATPRVQAAVFVRR